MGTVRWAAIGASAFTRRVMIPAMQRARGVHLLGVAAREANRAQDLCRQFGLPRPYSSYDELLSDPDAVYIYLVNSLHFE